MGLLDDAIREHLDLKRRRGGDPAEIEKAEQDALGPVRRDAPAAVLSDRDPASAPVFADAAVDPAPVEDFEFIEPGHEAEEHPTVLAGPADPYGEDDVAVSGVLDAAFGGGEADDRVSGDAVEVDEFDLPGDGPIAAMPPAPEQKSKRRHLFHFRSHDRDDVFADAGPLPEMLPEDDPFADEPAGGSSGGADSALGFEEDRSRPRPTGPRPTEGVEAVGRAQPLARDQADGAASGAGVAGDGGAGDVGAGAGSPPPALRLTDTAPGSTGRQPASPRGPEPGRTVEYDVEQAFADEDMIGGSRRRAGGDSGVPARPAAAPGGRRDDLLDDDFDEFEVQPGPSGRGGAGTSGDGEDILEETPDFLADAPDHDRLWFEQKPPPDFDFDN